MITFEWSQELSTYTGLTAYLKDSPWEWGGREVSAAMHEELFLVLTLPMNSSSKNTEYL